MLVNQAAETMKMMLMLSWPEVATLAAVAASWLLLPPNYGPRPAPTVSGDAHDASPRELPGGPAALNPVRVPENLKYTTA